MLNKPFVLNVGALVVTVAMLLRLINYRFIIINVLLSAV